MPPANFAFSKLSKSNNDFTGKSKTLLRKMANAARIINLAKEEKDKMTKTEKALG